MSYLKAEDVGTGLTMTFLALSPLQTKKKKDGGTYECHEITVKLHSGKVETYNVFPNTTTFGNEGERLSDCQTGDQVMAYAKGDFVNWKRLGQGEETLSKEQPSNYQQAQREAALAEKDKHYAMRDDSLGIRGLVQAFISAGVPDQEALNRGIGMHNTINKYVMEKHNVSPQA